MRAPQPVRSAQAGPSENRIAPAPQLQTKSADAGGSGGIAAPPIVHDVLRSSGQPLDAATRAFMEPRFRHDFSKVRVHADARAAESARAVNALAYTVGPNIVFGAGRYTPATPDGSRLIAHELTHVRQQQNYSQLSGLESPHLQRAIESESEEAALQEEEAEGGADQEEFLSEEMMGSVANGPFGPWPWMRKKPRSHRKNFQGGGLISALGGTKAVYTHHRHLDFFRRRRPPCNAVTLNIGFQWVSVQPVPTNQAVMNANIARIVRNWQPCNRSIQIVINTPASSNPPPPAWFVAVMNARAALIQQALILGGIPAGAFLPPVINYNQPGTQNAQVLIR
jgi:hypothetical protein